jgi:cystinosin
LNFQNQSTEGWSIGQILFDLTGGILSLTQLILDSSLQDDWSGLWNPTKLGLAVVSMSFDLIFITQHFILYRESSRTSNDKDLDHTAELQQPLLGN